MAKMLVIGSLELADETRSTFLKSLGAEIADQGHHLLNGCRNDLDRIVAEGAFERLTERGWDPMALITCYVADASPRAHKRGTILNSRCPSWKSLASPGLEVPETVQLTDVVIVIGGTEGTECAANWARIARKPIVPVTTFGGSAARIYGEELREFAAKYADRLDRSEYERLNQIQSDVRKLAKDIVVLAAKAITSRHVFVAMSFANDPKFDDAYESIQVVCGELHYNAQRITNADAIDRLVW